MSNESCGKFIANEKQIADELYTIEAREIIKMNILDNCLIDTRDAAQMIAERTHAEVVQVIGNRFVIYRAAKKPVIELPKVKKG